MEKFILDFLGDYTSESILAELQRVDSIVAKPFLSKRDFDDNSKVNSSTVIRRFGGWKKALAAAGLSHKYSGKSITKKQRHQESKSMSDGNYSGARIQESESRIEDVYVSNNLLPYLSWNINNSPSELLNWEVRPYI